MIFFFVTFSVHRNQNEVRKLGGVNALCALLKKLSDERVSCGHLVLSSVCDGSSTENEWYN